MRTVGFIKHGTGQILRDNEQEQSQQAEQTEQKDD